jgi:cbb3-type cytochrome oxidase subunit 3
MVCSFNTAEHFQYDVTNDQTAAAVAATVAASLCFLLVVCCVWRAARRRRRARREHFTRLVSDLNAAEKFAIVGPSDDDDSTDED